MKRPAFQFYPTDWRTDMALRQCSCAARGFWMDILCLMHEGTPYGYLTSNGKDIHKGLLARLTGEDEKDVSVWLSELETHNVVRKNEQGQRFSARMVRDEYLRQVRAAGGVKSLDNPNVPKRKKDIHEGDPARRSPSSSSSSTSTNNRRTKSAPWMGRVKQAWALKYPGAEPPAGIANALRPLFDRFSEDEAILRFTGYITTTPADFLSFGKWVATQSDVAPQGKEDPFEGMGDYVIHDWRKDPLPEFEPGR